MLRGLTRGLVPKRANQLLFDLRDANFQSTSDQQFRKLFKGQQYLITHVQAVRKTGGASVACAGGIYTAASKGGSALVAAVQSWLGLSGALKAQTATIAAVAGSDVHTATPYLSLTTGSTAAVTADVFIFGTVLD